MSKIILIVVFIFIHNLNGSYLDKANSFLFENDINKSIKFYKLSAREGSDEANFQLGKIYYLKKYQRRDLNKAYQYFKKAAVYEHLKAKYNLAIVYSQRDFEKHNYKEAYKLFLSLARLGHANAQYMTGIYLLKAKGVEKDYAMAKQWFEVAYFKNKYVPASCALSYIYANGLGVIQNLGRARKLSFSYIKEYPLCKSVFKEFKLYKKKYREDKGFKFGYYK